MNVIKEKNVNVFFDGEVKNPVAVRINSLARGRKLTEAAQDWGVNYNTLRNYFVRENARPKRDTLEKISIAEGVSVEWLLTGRDSSEQKNAQNESEMSNYVESKVVSTPLVQLLLTLSDSEQTRLYKMLARKGVETILCLLDEDNIKLLQLPESVKAGVLRLAKGPDTAIREILSTVEQDDPPKSLADKKAV
ncbi:hypothetical protein QCD58_002126 [Enterobacter hormaechei]|nr:hypothetical protein [Enterobacter hormaechei]